MNDNRCALFKDAIQRPNFSSVVDAVDVNVRLADFDEIINTYVPIRVKSMSSKDLSKPWIDRFV